MSGNIINNKVHPDTPVQMDEVTNFEESVETVVPPLLSGASSRGFDTRKKQLGYALSAIPHEVM
jgi:hypothetical protein